MKMRFFFVLCMIGFCIGVHGQEAKTKIKPAIMPVLLSENPINTSMNERDIAISPDGNEMFYTVYLQAARFHSIIYCRKEKNGKWSPPQVASFSGSHSDLEPAFSPDGKKLFFSSNRPEDNATATNFNIWFVEKLNGLWSSPTSIGAPVNTPADEFFPSVAANGNLYFTAAYRGGVGKEDIYIAKWKAGKYAQPVPLDTSVNSGFYEFNAFVTPDERYILFTSYGRKDDKGGGDIYISMKDENGKWAPATNAWAINSDKLDYCPFISFDNKTLFFTSERHALPESLSTNKVTYEKLKVLSNQVENGTGNIYQINWDAVRESIQ